MRNIFCGVLFAGCLFGCAREVNSQVAEFDPAYVTSHTPVKNQARTGTCWSFSVTSLIESLLLKDGMEQPDLSEMFTVRNIYIEKAKNYILRQGRTQFGEGGLGHDVIRSIALYGAMPEYAYTGLVPGKIYHDHGAMSKELKQYLDSLLIKSPVPPNWISGYEAILDKHMGKVPDTFIYQEVPYTPLAYASMVLEFDPADYVMITSFLHHPFYRPFTLEIPDNFSSGQYYNVPLDELIDLTKSAVRSGFSVMWDADVSNRSFRQNEGIALYPIDESVARFDPDLEEKRVDAALRQDLFERLITQDDHLMHLVGISISGDGREFFKVKNSWGEVGPYGGYIYVSENYFALNTISLVVPRKAFDPVLLGKLGIEP